MSDVVDQLNRARAHWPELDPVFRHAIALAKEAEYQADRASNEALSYVQPAYPVLVGMLAETMAPAPANDVVPF